MMEYPNLLRLRYEHIQQFSNKRYVEAHLEKDFFKSKSLVVEEKIDGSQCAIGWKNGRPYAQGRATHILDFDKRVAFDGLWSWIYQHTAEIEKSAGHLVFGEWMKPQHSVVYDNLPDFFIAFDVYDQKVKRFLNRKKKEAFLEGCGISCISLVFEGKCSRLTLPELVDEKPSNYSSTDNMEGCVVKDYDRQMFLKYVSREFLDNFDDSGHWTSRATVKYNRLASWGQSPS